LNAFLENSTDHMTVISLAGSPANYAMFRNFILASGQESNRRGWKGISPSDHSRQKFSPFHHPREPS
jgi:hypothetical protein